MRKIVYLLLGLFIASVASAQSLDPTLSAWDQQPLSVNPALAGNNQYKWRAAATYREVYYSVSRPYRTTAFNFDVNLPIPAWSGSIWGIGFSVLNDDIGDARLTNRRYNGTISIGQYLDPNEKHSLSVGFQGGLGQRGIVYDDVYWDNQWTGQGFQLRTDPREPLTQDVKNYFDLSSGLQYQYHDPELMDITAGIAVYHFNRPDGSLLSEYDEQPIERRWNVHFLMQHRVRENGTVAFRPSFLFSRQGQFDVLILGNDFRFILSDGTRTTGKRKASSIDLGVHHRWGTDVIAKVAFNLAGLQFGATYDFAVSNISNVNGNIIGPEVFFGYRGGFQKGLFNNYNRWNKGKL